MILYMVEVLTAGMIMVIIATQIIIPLFRGTPIFPAMQRHGIEAKLEQAKQEIRIAELEKQLVSLQQQANDIRKPKEGK